MDSPNSSTLAGQAEESAQTVIVQSLRSAVRFLQRPDQPSLTAQCHAQELARIADQLERLQPKNDEGAGCKTTFSSVTSA